MKSKLIAIVAAVVLVGCGESQQSAPAPEANPVEPVAEVAQPELPTAKAPDISIHDAAARGNVEAVREHLAAGADINSKKTGFGNGLTPLHVATKEGHNVVQTTELEPSPQPSRSS